MAVVATGFFDGVHIGHREVIKTLVSLARERGEEAIVITFADHPRAVLQQDAPALRLLSSTEEKKEMLTGLGVDAVEVLPFSRELYGMTARQYLLDVVEGRFGGTAVVLGYDNRLGSDKLTPELIAPVAGGLGLDAVVVPQTVLPEGGLIVSSTKIRDALSLGMVEQAADMLGYEYFLRGVVVSGKRFGRVIGFPTANMQMYDPLKMLPARGAYLTEVETLGRRFYGMTNVGDIVETHIFGFGEYIYGLDIRVKFKKRLRDERRFADGDDLKAQLTVDAESCRVLCEGLPRL